MCHAAPQNTDTPENPLLEWICKQKEVFYGKIKVRLY